MTRVNKKAQHQEFYDVRKEYHRRTDAGESYQAVQAWMFAEALRIYGYDPDMLAAIKRYASETERHGKASDSEYLDEVAELFLKNSGGHLNEPEVKRHYERLKAISRKIAVVP